MSALEYELKESRGLRTMRITVTLEGNVVVSAPRMIPHALVTRFVERKRAWIDMMRARAQKRTHGKPLIVLPRNVPGSRAHRDAVERARALVQERLQYFSHTYGFSYGRVSIRNQKTRWGSCSGLNNLSFNYRIVYLPPALVDYLIVHELAHTKEHNHSSRFWKVVADIVPDYKERRQTLRNQYVLK